MTEICTRTGYAPSGVRSLLYKMQQTGAVKMIALEDRRSVDLDSLLQFESVKRCTRQPYGKVRAAYEGRTTARRRKEPGQDSRFTLDAEEHGPD